MSNPPAADPQPNPLNNFELDLLKQEYFFGANHHRGLQQADLGDQSAWYYWDWGYFGFDDAAQSKCKCDRPYRLCHTPILLDSQKANGNTSVRGFYSRVAEIESILSDSYGLRSPKIYGGWFHYFKRTPSPTPKHRGDLWDGLLNRSVFVTYVLEIVFLLLMAGIAPRLWK